ncbi:MAG: acyl-CoA desaturase [Planctomycetaceae bacterium]
MTATALSSPANAPRTTSGDLPVKFAHCDGFLPALRQRVDAYFEQNHISKRDCPAMYVKSATILVWAVVSYVGLVWFAATWWQALLLAISLGVAMAAVGFNIQHDGGHNAYSRFPLVNRFMSMTLDVLGGSSYLWKTTHNIIHHSYTNVTGVDGDIDLGFLGRISPHQKRYGFHRFQHFYLWLLYGFITFKWQFRDDIVGVATGRIGHVRINRPKGRELLIYVVGKVIFLSLAFVIPMMFHPVLTVLAWFCIASYFQGVLLSVVFQLAHCVEEADFPMPEESTGRLENAWAVHQVRTTVDWARRNRFMTWLSGGLNYQIEHHLFPQICHIHYPAMAKIVEDTSVEHGIEYHVHQTFLGGLKAHYRWLKRMGQPDPATAA